MSRSSTCIPERRTRSTMSTRSYWRPARPRTTSCTSHSRVNSPTSAGSATASHHASSTTPSTKESSPAASSGRRRSATSTRASSSASRRRTRSTHNCRVPTRWKWRLLRRLGGAHERRQARARLCRASRRHDERRDLTLVVRDDGVGGPIWAKAQASSVCTTESRRSAAPSRLTAWRGEGTCVAVTLPLAPEGRL